VHCPVKFARESAFVVCSEQQFATMRVSFQLVRDNVITLTRLPAVVLFVFVVSVLLKCNNELSAAASVARAAVSIYQVSGVI
jgi:hypothetical protein